MTKRSLRTCKLPQLVEHIVDLNVWLTPSGRGTIFALKKGEISLLVRRLPATDSLFEEEYWFLTRHGKLVGRQIHNHVCVEDWFRAVITPNTTAGSSQF
jgi:hypothetical protein